MLRDYVAVDLEMTGLNAKRDHILEFGAVRVQDKKIVSEFQALIHPPVEIAREVMELTGITNEMAAKGEELEQVFPDFIDFCGTAVLLGHNVIFDYSFLKQAALNYHISFERSGVDTLKLARMLLPEGEKKTLQALCDRYGIERERRHRALDDAKAASALYELLEQQYEAGNPKLFEPSLLVYKAKKQLPATARQKKHLKELAEYHHVALDASWETLTKNEASRTIDQLIRQYGRMPKKEFPQL